MFIDETDFVVHNQQDAQKTITCFSSLAQQIPLNKN